MSRPRRRGEIIDDIVSLDMEEADWRRKMDDCDNELASMQVWGKLILDRRMELIRELRRAQKRAELRREKGLDGTKGVNGCHT